MSPCSEPTKTVSIASPIYFSCINQLTICYMQLIQTHWNCDRQDCLPGLCSASFWTAESNTLRTLRYVHENPTVSIHQYRTKEFIKINIERFKLNGWLCPTPFLSLVKWSGGDKAFVYFSKSTPP
ncbi:F5U2 [Hyposoter didymator ichnovirus]|nr:F5U2 [Hyposoter didymator ichnovirus]